MNLSDLQTVIDSCHRASVDGAEWPKTLDLIGDQFHASGAGIVSHDVSRNASTVHSTSLADADEPYRSHWWKHDTRIAIAKRLKFKPGDVISDFHLIADDAKRRDPFFQEFGRPYGFDELMGYFAQDPLGGLMTVSVMRGGKVGAFESEELNALKTIGVHVAHAFTMTATLSALRSRNRVLEQGLGSAHVGIVVLDDADHVIDMTPSALGLMRDCLRVTRDRVLSAANAVEQPKLDAILDKRRGDMLADPPRCTILRAKDGDLRLLVETVAIRASDCVAAIAGCRDGRTMLLLRDFAMGRHPSIAHHLEQMGLTASEARVATRIGRGSSPKQVAVELAVSHHTVRVHMRSIYGKLAINRQSELAAIVSRLDCLLG